ncbi:MAG: hypothetical protein ACKO7W_11545 [Elainella sp.]
METLPLEREIQDHIYQKLLQWGESAQLEVSVPGGRADIVTSDTVYEVKRELDREAIYQAAGQGSGYAGHLGKPNIVVIGLAPSSSKREAALSAKRSAEGTANLQVVFIDEDPAWGWGSVSQPPPEPVKQPTSVQDTPTSPDVTPSRQTAGQFLEFLIVLTVVFFGMLLLRQSADPPKLYQPACPISSGGRC